MEEEMEPVADKQPFDIEAWLSSLRYGQVVCCSRLAGHEYATIRGRFPGIITAHVAGKEEVAFSDKTGRCMAHGWHCQLLLNPCNENTVRAYLEDRIKEAAYKGRRISHDDAIQLHRMLRKDFIDCSRITQLTLKNSLLKTQAGTYLGETHHAIKFSGGK